LIDYSSASDDLKNISKLRGVIEDILNLRSSKIQERLSNFKTADDFIPVLLFPRIYQK
jgi:hypothetical protein